MHSRGLSKRLGNALKRRSLMRAKRPTSLPCVLCVCEREREIEREREELV